MSGVKNWFPVVWWGKPPRRKNEEIWSQMSPGKQKQKQLQHLRSHSQPQQASLLALSLLPSLSSPWQHRQQHQVSRLALSLVSFLGLLQGWSGFSFSSTSKTSQFLSFWASPNSLHSSGCLGAKKSISPVFPENMSTETPSTSITS